MTNYVIAYRGGRKFATREAGAAYVARWQAWMAGLGNSIVEPGAPLGAGKQLSAAGISDRGSDLLTGYTIVTAGSLDTALELAKKCPHLDHGTIEVAEIMEMKMR